MPRCKHITASKQGSRFSKEPPLSTTRRWQQCPERRTETVPPIPRKRKRELSEKAQATVARRLCHSVYFFPTFKKCFIIENIQVIYGLPEVASLYLSSVVHQLKRKGIMPITAEPVRQNLPQAGPLWQPPSSYNYLAASHPLTTIWQPPILLQLHTYIRLSASQSYCREVSFGV